MEVFILRKRLMTAIWLVAMLIAFLLVVATGMHNQAGDSAAAASRYIIIQFVVGTVALSWVGLLAAHWFAPFIVKLRAPRARTSRDQQQNIQATDIPPHLRKTHASLVRGVIFSVIGLIFLTGALIYVFTDPAAKEASWTEFITNGQQTALEDYLNEDASGINRLDAQGELPLILAIKTGKTELVQCLLDHGANANAVNKKQEIALACAAASPEMVELLLNAGAKINTADRNGKTALHEAVLLKNRDAVLLLLEHGAKVNEKDSQGNTPLMLNVKADGDLVDDLLSYRADPTATDDVGQTPLHIATQENRIQIMTSLLRAEAKIESLSRQGWSPMHVAAMNASIEALELLLESGANINIENGRGQTPLSIAVTRNKLASVTYLLAHGADIEHTDEWGNSGLHLAMNNRNFEIVELLLSQGANMDQVSSAGVTVRDLLLAQGKEALVEKYAPESAEETVIAETEEAADEETSDQQKKANWSGLIK